MRRGDDGMPAMRPPSAVIGTDGRPGVVNDPRGATVATLPPDYQAEEGAPTELPPELRRQAVAYPTREPAGTIVIDTPHTHLYYVMGGGQAMRYGIGVGREGFAWAGVERVSRMTEWPDWFPPKEMIERQPYLPRMMAGGPANPLGARALYLGNTLYRIHGTNQPSTIGKFVSSGCIRMLNQDAEDLFRRVQVGTRVVVLSSNGQLASNMPGYVPSVSAPAAKPRKPRPVRAATISRTHPAAATAAPAAAPAAAPVPTQAAAPVGGAPAAAPAAPSDSEQKAGPDPTPPSAAAPPASQ
jgi:lipoprotein-anchoring transpeptidase ErfK/SrfK